MSLETASTRRPAPHPAPPRHVVAVADDLTGAAEIAGIGHSAGWRAEVATRRGAPQPGVLTAFDTDTRLATADVAARALAEMGRSLAAAGNLFIFKKTDSVLRGPVLAEVTALATALGRRAVLLVPANPSLGRTIRNGTYFVNGVPLHETGFAHDPHHPARTADVAALLGPGTISVCTPADPLPASGVIVGAASTADDIAAWARRLDDSMLAAGGRDFFNATLRARGLVWKSPGNSFVPARPTLLVCGSLVSPTKMERALSLPPDAVARNHRVLEQWMDRVLAALEAGAFAAVDCHRIDHPEAPERIRAAFAELVRRAVHAGSARHVMVEGGATASSILGASGWHRLAVGREWVPGVVTLLPAADPRLAITVKPGSYRWPDELWSLVTPRG